MLRTQRQHDDAKAHYERALRIFTVVLGENHCDVAMMLENMGTLCSDQVSCLECPSRSRRAQGYVDEAKRYYERALEIKENVFDEEHPDIASSLDSLGVLLEKQVGFLFFTDTDDIFAQKNLDEAEPLYQRALEIKLKVFGENDLGVVESMQSLAGLLLSKVSS